ncbi:hypothetical protein CPC08DRAFT_131696 [Agrocybe pediades]|nr:hypothetical protein CPC08DRAFT_131696 [Agrocybe pediades]
MTPRPILKNTPHPPSFSSSYEASESEADPMDSYSPFRTPDEMTALPFSSAHHVPPLDSPHVHFPPTPSLSRIAMTHSSFSYDRRSIEVSPNICELPERGERKLEDGDYDYFHPHMYHSPHPSGSTPPSPPPVAPNRSGARSASPSDGNRRRHRRPTPILSYSTTRFYPAHSGPDQSIPERPRPEPFPGMHRHQHHHPLPSHHQNQEQRQSDTSSIPPPLVSDVSSSDTDLDTCGTPPVEIVNDTTAQPGIVHISTHFPGGMSVGPANSILHGEGDERTLSLNAMHISNARMGALTAKKVKGKPKSPTSDVVPLPSPEDSADDPMVLDGLKFRPRTRKLSKPKPSAAFHSPSDLGSVALDDADEGCLGGF